MTPEQKIKKVCALFAKSLDDKKCDEWWCTDRNVWEEMSKRFVGWICQNRKKIQHLWQENLTQSVDK